MRSFFLIIALYLLASAGNAQDFRNAQWGDNPETVLKNETLPLVSKTMNYKMLHLNYVEFTESDVYFTYTYLFYNNKLIGVKRKTAYLTQDNSRYNVEQLYRQTYQTYHEKYQNLKEERKDNISKFNVVLKDKKIYVEMRNEDNEYFLMESFMSSKKG